MTTFSHYKIFKHKRLHYIYGIISIKRWEKWAQIQIRKILIILEIKNSSCIIFVEKTFQFLWHSMPRAFQLIEAFFFLSSCIKYHFISVHINTYIVCVTYVFGYTTHLYISVFICVYAWYNMMFIWCIYDVHIFLNRLVTVALAS
jgi:hypothetical protein